MKLLSLIGGMIFGLLVFAYAMADESRDQKTKEQRSIPLSEIVTTSPQKELRSIRDAWEKDTRQPAGSFDTFMRQLHGINNGSSNAFVVDATNLYDALSASINILTSLRRADTPAPVNTSQPERGSHWMVAYLGTGPSEPTWWTVKSVKVEKSKVVLRYRESPPRPATDDVRHYYFWIPLGTVAPGAYEIQLLDADKEAVTLMRRVEVSATNTRGGTR